MSPRCTARVVYGTFGPLEQSRPCKRPRAVGPYCTLHSKSRVSVVVVGGGMCVWCGALGRRYVSEAGGTSICFCDRCMKSLSAAGLIARAGTRKKRDRELQPLAELVEAVASGGAR
jgi:hypothetical protein